MAMNVLCHLRTGCTFPCSCGFHASQLKFCIPGMLQKFGRSHLKSSVSDSGRGNCTSSVFIIHMLTHSSETGPQGHLLNRSHGSVIRFPIIVLCTAACAGRPCVQIYILAKAFMFKLHPSVTSVYFKKGADRHCCTCGVFRVRPALRSERNLA